MSSFPTDLTPGEIRVLQLVATGAPNVEIGQELWLTEQTIKFHVSNCLRKLGVANRTAAVWRALELGLITAPNGDPRPRACPTCGRPFE